jgi:V/A-type H+-transporting ATPase subunit D
MDEQLRLAFKALEIALVRSGRAKVSSLAVGSVGERKASVSSRRVMGVALPRVEVASTGPALSSSLAETTFWVDEAKARFARAAECMAALAETRVGLRRLGREVKKTIRRVNALEKIALPGYETDLHYIGAVLDEMDRQNFFTMKLIKNRLSQRRSSRGR